MEGSILAEDRRKKSVVTKCSNLAWSSGELNIAVFPAGSWLSLEMVSE